MSYYKMNNMYINFAKLIFVPQFDLKIMYLMEINLIL